MVQLESMNGDDGLQCFEFVFNCRAFASILYEMEHLTNIVVGGDRATAEEIKYSILKRAVEIVGWENYTETNLESFIDEFGLRFLRARASGFKELHGLEHLRVGLLEPCEVLSRYCGRILNPYIGKPIVWMACFDEAEYLTEIQIKLLNSMMRSEREGMSIKLTTLPSHYTTMETLRDEVHVKSGGHDFSFVHIDFPSESEEYLGLCDQIISKRLRSLGVFENHDDSGITLRAFVGTDNNQPLTRLYYNYFGTSKEAFDKEIAEMLIQRSRTQNLIPHKKNIDRYIPIVAFKRLVKLHSSGRNHGVVNSGAERIKMITDGNFREFLRVMAALFRVAQKQELTQKRQHVAMRDYVRLRAKEALGIQSVGLQLYGLINMLKVQSSRLFNQTELAEGGCLAVVKNYAVEFPEISEMIKHGVASGYFLLSPSAAEKPVDLSTEFEISSILNTLFEVYPRKNQLPPLKLDSKEPCNEMTLPLFNFKGDEIMELEDLP